MPAATNGEGRHRIEAGPRPVRPRRQLYCGPNVSGSTRSFRVAVDDPSAEPATRAPPATEHTAVAIIARRTVLQALARAIEDPLLFTLGAEHLTVDAGFLDGDGGVRSGERRDRQLGPSHAAPNGSLGRDWVYRSQTERPRTLSIAPLVLDATC